MPDELMAEEARERRERLQQRSLRREQQRLRLLRKERLKKARQENLEGVNISNGDEPDDEECGPPWSSAKTLTVTFVLCICIAYIAYLIGHKHFSA